MPAAPPATLDLDAYFARLGYTGPREATLATLRALQFLHPQAIPFENLDVRLGRPIRLDLASIQQKLIHDHRGGYCFEQNTFFAAVLRALGFTVTALLARVRWMVPAEVTLPRTHMILRVLADGRPWLADAGFGGAGLTGPLALDTDAEQPTPHETRRLVFEPSGHLLHQLTFGDGAWHDLYRFTLEDVPPIDFEVANWFTSTHPDSRFKKVTMVARAGPDHRLALLDRELTVRYLDGRTERRSLASHAEQHEVLATRFGLTLPAEAEV